MSKKECPAGRRWDSLIKLCLPTAPDHTRRGERRRQHDRSSDVPPSVSCIGHSGGLTHVTGASREVPPRRPRSSVTPLTRGSAGLGVAVLGQRRTTPRGADPSAPVTVLVPALWIFVVLTTVGSILTLILWFITCRRQSSLRSTAGDVHTGTF